MYADNTLLPKESNRLCALGTLAQAARPVAYSELANSVRHFTAHIMGPSLDMMGSSLEMMKLEGLIEPVETSDETGDELLQLTDEGRDAFSRLLQANLRDTNGELNRLILALKFRFLHLLEKDAQRDQIEILADVCETELLRLIDLRASVAQEPSHLPAWLDLEIELMKTKLSWLRERKG